MGRRVLEKGDAPKHHRHRVEKAPVTQQIPKVSSDLPLRPRRSKVVPKPKIKIDWLWIAAWCVAGLCLGVLLGALSAGHTVTVVVAAVGLVATCYFIWDEWIKKGKINE